MFFNVENYIKFYLYIEINSIGLFFMFIGNIVRVRIMNIIFRVIL